MPEYLSPGTGIEETNPGPPPIVGVPTSTAGFVGQTIRGPLGARMVTSWIDFTGWFGGWIDAGISYLPYAVEGFFANGGQLACVARVVPPGTPIAALNLATTGASTLQVTAAGPGDWGQRVFVRVTHPPAGAQPVPPDPVLFRLQILYFDEMPPLNGGVLIDPLDPANAANPDRRDPSVVEDFNNLSADPLLPSFAVPLVNAASRLVQLRVEPDINSTLGLPMPMQGFAPLACDPAAPAPAAIAAQDYIGNHPGTPSGEPQGLAALEQIEAVALLCVPDEVHPALGAGGDAIRAAVLNQCERRRDRFAILQVAANNGDVGQIQPPADTSFAAIYYPWLRLQNPVDTSQTLLVPPGGHVAGIYARTDLERGVHQAPANEEVRGMLLTGPLEFTITNAQQKFLTQRSINVIRDFRPVQRGIRVWSARTLASDPDWRYVSVRRLFLYVEQSILRGMQWVVFEPNDEPLWAMARRSISSFLLQVWQTGALQGTRPEDAFFVRCDRTTMTQDDILNGRLICLMGLAPVRPGEFVILRCQLLTREAAQA